MYFHQYFPTTHKIKKNKYELEDFKIQRQCFFDAKLITNM